MPSSTTPAFAAPTALPRSSAARPPLCTQRNAPSMLAKKEPGGGGFFKKMRDAVLRPVVMVPGSGGSGELLDCVFCKGCGTRDCSGCKGNGKDALGTCIMCDGAGVLSCDVCSGVGLVDKVRRGGTDDRNEYTIKGQRPRK